MDKPAHSLTRAYIGTRNRLAGSAIHIADTPQRPPGLAIGAQAMVRTRQVDLAFPDSSPRPLPPGEPVWALAGGPDGWYWVGQRLGGLHLRRLDGSAVALTMTQGLPGMSVRDLETLTGLLLTHGLLAVSPYRSLGEVGNPMMFFGRERLINQLLDQPPPQLLLVGPRRVGKTSLLRRLQTELPPRHPGTEVVFLNMLGLSTATDLLGALARALKCDSMPSRAAGDSETEQVEALLRRRFEGTDGHAVILVDEADSLVEADARQGFRLLNQLKRLEGEGVCSFVLAGFWHLFRHTLNHASPVYDFAPVHRLGPLDEAAALSLTREPIQRIGIRFSEMDLPVDIVSCPGGYPSLVQFLCDQLLQQLGPEQDLCIDAAHLRRVRSSQDVCQYLREVFQMNTGGGAQLLVLNLLEHDSFGLVLAHERLEALVDGPVPLWVIERILLQLTLTAILRETGGDYCWNIPLLREILLADPARSHRSERLLGDLSPHHGDWITPPQG